MLDCAPRKSRKQEKGITTLLEGTADLFSSLGNAVQGSREYDVFVSYVRVIDGHTRHVTLISAVYNLVRTLAALK